jgi:hypothetical protein
MQTYEQPTIERLQSSPPIYVLLDKHGNLIGAGSLDILEVVLDMSERCVKAIGRPPSTLTATPAPTNYRSPRMSWHSEF